MNMRVKKFLSNMELVEQLLLYPHYNVNGKVSLSFLKSFLLSFSSSLFLIPSCFPPLLPPLSGLSRLKQASNDDVIVPEPYLVGVDPYGSSFIAMEYISMCGGCFFFGFFVVVVVVVVVKIGRVYCLLIFLFLKLFLGGSDGQLGRGVANIHAHKSDFQGFFCFGLVLGGAQKRWSFFLFFFCLF